MRALSNKATISICFMYFTFKRSSTFSSDFKLFNDTIFLILWFYSLLSIDLQVQQNLYLVAIRISSRPLNTGNNFLMRWLHHSAILNLLYSPVLSDFVISVVDFRFNSAFGIFSFLQEIMHLIFLRLHLIVVFLFLWLEYPVL